MDQNYRNFGQVTERSQLHWRISEASSLAPLGLLEVSEVGWQRSYSCMPGHFGLDFAINCNVSTGVWEPVVSSLTSYCKPCGAGLSGVLAALRAAGGDQVVIAAAFPGSYAISNATFYSASPYRVIIGCSAASGRVGVTLNLTCLSNATAETWVVQATGNPLSPNDWIDCGPSLSRTPSPTATPSSTLTPTASCTGTASASASASASSTPSSSRTSTSTPSSSSSASGTPWPSPLPPRAGPFLVVQPNSALTAVLPRVMAAQPLAPTENLLVSPLLPPATARVAVNTTSVYRGFLASLTLRCGVDVPLGMTAPACRWEDGRGIAGSVSVALVGSDGSAATTAAVRLAAAGPRAFDFLVRTNATHFPRAACALSLRCALIFADASLGRDTLISAAGVGVVVLAARVPALTDVVVDLPTPGVSGSRSFRSALGGSWVPLPAASAAARGGSATDGNATAAVAARNVSTAAAAATRQQAFVPLSLLTNGRMEMTLVGHAGLSPAVDGLALPPEPATLRPLLRGQDGAVHVLRPYWSSSSSSSSSTAPFAMRLSLPSYADMCGEDRHNETASAAASAPPCSRAELQALSLGTQLRYLLSLERAALPSPAFQTALTAAEVGGLGLLLRFPPLPVGVGAWETLLPQLYAAVAPPGAASDAASQSLQGGPQLSVRYELLADPAAPSTDAGLQYLVATVAAPPPAALRQAASDAPPGPLATLQAALASGRGIEYTRECTAGGFLDPVTFPEICANVSSPARALCGWGEGDACAPCPPSALCPGGFTMLPLPGYWVPSTRGSAPKDLVACLPPATERCPGAAGGLGSSLCGPGYRQSSYACSACSPGFYASDAAGGRCLRCPGSASLWDLLRPVFVLIGWLLVGLIPAAALVVWAQVRRGGTLRQGALRALKFLQVLVTALQILIQAQSSSPQLPAVLAELYSRLEILQFKGVVQPGCASPGDPLAADRASLAFSLALAALWLGLAAALWWRATPRAATCCRRKQAPLAHALPAAGGPASSSSVFSAPRHAFATVAKQVSAATAWRKVVATASALSRPLLIVTLLLYARTMSLAYKDLRCVPATMTLEAYLDTLGDGTALATLGLDPASFPLLRACAGLDPVAGVSWLSSSCPDISRVADHALALHVVFSEPTVICGEGAHVATAGLAIATIVLYGVMLPAGVAAWVALRVRKAKAAAASSPLANTAPTAVAHGETLASTICKLVGRVRRWLRCSKGSHVLAAADADEGEPSRRRAPPGAAEDAALAPLAAPGQPSDAFTQVSLGGPYRASHAWVHLVDLLILHVFAAFKAFFKPPPSYAATCGRLAVSLTLTATVCVLVVVRAPHREPMYRYINGCIYATTCLALGLVAAVEASELQATSGDGAGVPTPPATLTALISGLGYATFVGVIITSAVTLACFTSALLSGAAAERAAMQTQAAQQAAAKLQGEAAASAAAPHAGASSTPRRLLAFPSVRDQSWEDGDGVGAPSMQSHLRSVAGSLGESGDEDRARHLPTVIRKTAKHSSSPGGASGVPGDDASVSAPSAIAALLSSGVARPSARALINRPPSPDHAGNSRQGARKNPLAYSASQARLGVSARGKHA